MTLRDIAYITAIEEEKSITKAAAKLFVAQPALSQCLQRVEKELGSELFVRTTNGVQLTVEGKCFLKFAETTLLAQQNMQKEMKDIQNAEGGEILLGLTGTQATYVLPYFLPRFKQMYPNIEITLVEDSSSLIEEKLANGAIDIGIVHFPIMHENLEYFELSHDDMVIVPRSCSHFQKHIYYQSGDDRPYLNIDFLQEEYLVLTPQNQRSRMVCDQIFAKAGIIPHIKQTSRNLCTLDALAQVDYASTLIPSKQISDALRRRGVYYIDPSYNVPYSFCVVTLKDRYISKATQRLLCLLKELRETF